MEQLTAKQFITLSKKLNKLAMSLIGTDQSAEFYTHRFGCDDTCYSSHLTLWFHGDVVTSETFEIRAWYSKEENLQQLDAATARVNELLGIN